MLSLLNNEQLDLQLHITQSGKFSETLHLTQLQLMLVMFDVELPPLHEHGFAETASYQLLTAMSKTKKGLPVPTYLST